MWCSVLCVYTAIAIFVGIKKMFYGEGEAFLYTILKGSPKALQLFQPQQAIKL